MNVEAAVSHPIISMFPIFNKSDVIIFETKDISQYFLTNLG